MDLIESSEFFLIKTIQSEDSNDSDYIHIIPIKTEESTQKFKQDY